MIRATALPFQTVCVLVTSAPLAPPSFNATPVPERPPMTITLFPFKTGLEETELSATPLVLYQSSFPVTGSIAQTSLGTEITTL